MKILDFDYKEDLDDEVICRGEIKIHESAIVIDALTVAGSKDGVAKKPNEDTFSVIRTPDSILAAIFDGCSSQKPIASLKEQTGARFASHFLKKAFEEKEHTDLPEQLIRLLNKELLAKSIQFEGATLSDVHTLPASTATIVQLDLKEKKLRISHVGDTFCIIQFKDNHTEFVTIDRNRKYDNEVLGLVRKIANEKQITPREARKDERIKRAIVAIFQDSYNKSDGTGQGVMNGDPNVEQYIQDISFPLDSIKALLIGSDGLVPPGWDEQNEKDREKMFAAVKSLGVQELIRIKKEIENSDPDWQFVRYKHSDDATGIYISLEE